MKPGDMVVLAVDDHRLIMPEERSAGIIVRVRDVKTEGTRWVDGVLESEDEVQYADVLIDGHIRENVPCAWMGVISEAG